MRNWRGQIAVSAWLLALVTSSAPAVLAEDPPPPPKEEQPAEPPAQAEPAQPEPAQPAPAEPEPAQPEPAQPEPAQPEPAQPAPAEPEPAQPEPAQPAPAQPEPAPAPPPAPAPGPTAPAPTEEPPATAPSAAGKEKMPFALYVGAVAGMGSMDDLNTSVAEDELNVGINSLDITDQLYGRAVVGWKLPRGRGAFRLIFQGVKEDDYEFSSRGSTNKLPNNETIDEAGGLVPWWFIDVEGGHLRSRQLEPQWSDAADADGDGVGDFGACSDLGGGQMQCGEITYDTNAPLREVTGEMSDDLQNRIQTWDVVYGREFGKGRYTSRWWGGLRYFEYQGNLLAGAWLTSGHVGDGFTDGSFLRLLNIEQDTSGIGPVGSWEVDFNFYERGLQLFLRGEAAFMVNKMEMDSGPFFHVLSSSEGTIINDRVESSLDKSTWQDRLEGGARIYLKNGLEFELGYSIAGYLDVVLFPDRLLVNSPNTRPQIATQDIIVQTVHVGAGFQF